MNSSNNLNNKKAVPASISVELLKNERSNCNKIKNFNFNQLVFYFKTRLFLKSQLRFYVK